MKESPVEKSCLWFRERFDLSPCLLSFGVLVCSIRFFISCVRVHIITLGATKHTLTMNAKLRFATWAIPLGSHTWLETYLLETSILTSYIRDVGIRGGNEENGIGRHNEVHWCSLLTENWLDIFSETNRIDRTPEWNSSSSTLAIE